MARKPYSPILKCASTILNEIEALPLFDYRYEVELLQYASEQVDLFEFELDTKEAFLAWYIEHLNLGILGPVDPNRFDTIWKLWYRNKYELPAEVTSEIDAFLADLKAQAD